MIATIDGECADDHRHRRPADRTGDRGLGHGGTIVMGADGGCSSCRLLASAAGPRSLTRERRARRRGDGLHRHQRRGRNFRSRLHLDPIQARRPGSWTHQGFPDFLPASPSKGSFWRPSRRSADWTASIGDLTVKHPLLTALNGPFRVSAAGILPSNEGRALGPDRIGPFEPPAAAMPEA